MKLSFLEALTMREDGRLVKISPQSLNIGLWNYYKEDFKASYRILFEKMQVLQRSFGVGKPFAYDRKRFVSETGLGKEAIRTAIDKLDLMGILKVNRYKKVNEASYTYQINYDGIIRNLDQIWDKEKIKEHDPDADYYFSTMLPAYYKVIKDGHPDKKPFVIHKSLKLDEDVLIDHNLKS